MVLIKFIIYFADPRKLPKGLNDAETIEVAPPVMTYETRASTLYHIKSIGDTFKVSCEALGSPQPEIFWFKDGQHIDEAVHYQRGKSTVEFSVLGSADAGVYTCRARNLIGEVTQNYTLEVKQPVGATHAVVTEAGPADATVVAGEVATLQCRVKSLAPPHIKWLKRLEGHEVSAENTLRVGNERYRILDANQDSSTGNDEYLNKLVITDSTGASSPRLLRSARLRSPSVMGPASVPSGSKTPTQPKPLDVISTMACASGAPTVMRGMASPLCMMSRTKASLAPWNGGGGP